MMSKKSMVNFEFVCCSSTLIDRCDGVSPSCPEDKRRTGEVCRAAAGACDVEGSKKKLFQKI